jgi:hypothetical protein
MGSMKIFNLRYTIGDLEAQRRGRGGANQVKHGDESDFRDEKDRAEQERGVGARRLAVGAGRAGGGSFVINLPFAR